MNPNLNQDASVGTVNHTRTANQAMRTFDWWFAARWSLAGTASAVFAVKVLTIPRPISALMFAAILIAAAGVAAGWIARGRTDGR